jgi:hypothetical protein
MRALRACFFFVCGAAIALAGGCGDDPTPPPREGVLTESLAQEAGAAIAEQAAGLVEQFTLDSVTDVPLSKAASLLPERSRLRPVLAAGSLRLRALASEECAALSDTTDTDLDGVPDNLVVSFSSPACTTVTDSGTAYISGSFTITDPGTAAGFDVTYSNLRLHVENLVGDYLDMRLNGHEGIEATGGTASLGENLTLVLTAHEGDATLNATQSQNWTATYTATATEYAAARPLASGQLTLTGSTSWLLNGEAFSFSMSTEDPLVHDAECLERPTIVSGQLRALALGSQGGAFVRIQFTGCGLEPIITFVARPQS